MKNWKEIMKTPAVAGLLVLCLVSAGLLVYMGVQLSKTHAEMAELESRISALQAELEILTAEAEAEGTGNTGDAEDAENAEENDSIPKETEKKPVQPQTPVSKYVSKEKVKENILGDLQYDDNPADLVFLSVTLDETSDPAVYNVVAETADKYRKHIYEVHAETGLIRDRIFYNADNFEEEGQIGLHHEIGDSSEPEPWNKYWELYCRPSGQAYYEDIPIIRFDSEEGRAYLEAQEEAKRQSAAAEKE